MDLTLKAEKRNLLGKKTKQLRNKGLVPAELYGRDIENRHLSIPSKEFKKVFKEAGKNVVINLEVGGEKIPVLITEVQMHPILQNYLTIDFYKIRTDEAIEANIPIEFTGTAPAEKQGLTIVKVLNEVSVRALPQNLPHHIEIDISGLEKDGDTIHVGDIKKIKDVEFQVSSETVIVTASEQEEEVEEEAAEPSPEDITVTEEKSEEIKEEMEKEKGEKQEKTPEEE